MAEVTRVRHRLVVNLLMVIGVPAEATESDAEGIEHHISDATLAVISGFLQSGWKG